MMLKGCGETKRQAIKDKCFNCHKMRHFGRDCTAPDSYPKKNKRTEEAPSQQQPKHNRAHITAVVDTDNLEPKPFRPGKANMAKETTLRSPKKV